MADRLLRVADVMAATGLGRSTIWRFEKAGTFPQRRKITGSTIGWFESEVAAWIEERPVGAGRSGPPPRRARAAGETDNGQ